MIHSSKRYLIIGIVIIAFLPFAFADEGLKDCSSAPLFGLGVTYNCLDKMYNQNIQIIQQQNQTNHLIAIEICEKNYFFVQYPDDNSVNAKDFTSCVNHILEVSH